MFDGFESVIKGDSQGDPEESTAAQAFNVSHQEELYRVVSQAVCLSSFDRGAS